MKTVCPTHHAAYDTYDGCQDCLALATERHVCGGREVCVRCFGMAMRRDLLDRRLEQKLGVKP